MQTFDPTQVTIISLLIAGITALWAYFTKQEGSREKREKDESKERESNLQMRISQKDDIIVKLAQDSIKASTEVRSSIDNNTTAIKDMGGLTKQVLDELIRIKFSKGNPNR